jgi:2-polyprenyl-3-methyl-5-hydroxy-6-metoxy-1,4-benzoquinol methylase
MCLSNATLNNVQQRSATAFGERMANAINDAALVIMTSVGHRTGLFDVMAEMDCFASSHQIAAKVKLSERYVREWLGAMVCGSVVQYDPETQTYCLPPAHAACLTRAASPNNVAVTAQWISLLGCVEDEVIDAFRHGRGVPYSAYKRFHEVMAEESDQTTVGGLFEHILPLVPGLSSKLAQGIEVLDIACGAGGAMLALAAAYPASRFVGYDFSEQAVAAARAKAARRGATNVRFEVVDCAELPDRHRFDLVTAFDAIHDQAKPAEVLRRIRAALKPDTGLFLMQDIKASSHVHNNCDHPLGTFVYTVSTMHCMSVSLANGGPGLGAAWGKELALTMLSDAGFRNPRCAELPHDPINYYYTATPA